MPNKRALSLWRDGEKASPSLYRCPKCNFIFDYLNWEQPPRLRDAPFHDNTPRCLNCGKKVSETHKFIPNDRHYDFTWRTCNYPWRNRCKTGTNVYRYFFTVNGEVYRGRDEHFQLLCECCHCGYIYDYTNWKREAERVGLDEKTGLITNQHFLTCPLCKQKNVVWIDEYYALWAPGQPNPYA